MPACTICSRQSVGYSKIMNTPVDAPSLIILLSSLARYSDLEWDSAKFLYQRSLRRQSRLCITHVVDVAFHLILELKEMIGEFPALDLSNVSDQVMDNFLAHIRMYGSLLEHGLCLEKKHVAQYCSGKFWTYRFALRKQFAKQGIPGFVIPKSKQMVTDLEVPGMPDLPLDQPSTSEIALDEATSKSIVANALRLFASDSEASISSSFVVPTDDIKDIVELQAPSSSNIVPQDETVHEAEICSLCLVTSSCGSREATSREQHLILLSGLVMCKEIDTDLAYRVYRNSVTERAHYCRFHFVKAALLFADEARKLCGRLPVHEFNAPKDTKAEILQRIQKISLEIDSQAKLQTGDLIKFYNECQAEYHKNEGFSMEPAESAKYSHGRCIGTVKKKDALNERVVIPAKYVSPYGLDRNRETFICLICGKKVIEEDTRPFSVLPDHNIILLCCLILGYSLPVDLARIIYREMTKSKRCCKKHYIQAGVYLADEIQIFLGQSPPRDFKYVPYPFRESLLNRLQTLASAVYSDGALTLDHLTRFYNDCQVRYRTDAGNWTVLDLLKKARSELLPHLKPTGAKDICRKNHSSTRKRPPSDDPDYVPVKQLCEQLNKRPREEHLLALRRAECSCCSQLKFSKTLRVISEEGDIIKTLLSCLLLCHQIGLKKAYELLTKCRQMEKRICHEHFVCAGEFLQAEFEQRYGECTKDLILYDPRFQNDPLYFRLLEVSDLIEVDKEQPHLTRASLAYFYDDYQQKYLLAKKVFWKQPEEDEDQNKEFEEQEIYVCDNTGVEEIPFRADELLPKQEPMEHREVYGTDDEHASTEGSDLAVFSEVKAEPRASSSASRQTDDNSVDEKPSEYMAADSPVELAMPVHSPMELDMPSNNSSTSPPQFSEEKPPPCQISTSSGIDVYDGLPENAMDDHPSFIAVSAADLLGITTPRDIEDSHKESGRLSEKPKRTRISTGKIKEASTSGKIVETSTSAGMYEKPKTSTSRKTEEASSAEDEDTSKMDDIIESVSRGSGSVPDPQPMNAVLNAIRRKEDQPTGGNGVLKDTLPPDELRLLRAMHKSNPNKSFADLARELSINPATVVFCLRKNVFKDTVLSEEQLQNRLEICSSLAMRNRREPFLPRIITYGERMVHFEWRKRVPLGEDVPGNKALLTVWWCSNGLLCHQFLQNKDKNALMNADLFLHQFREVCRKMREECPELARAPILLLENPRPHMNRDIMKEMHRSGVELLPYPPHANDLLPSQYHFFSQFFRRIDRRDYFNLDCLRKDFRVFIKNRSPYFYADGINQLASRWNRCVEFIGH